MAFKDSNGRITIDEVAANKDIANLNKTLESLEGTLNYLNQIIALAETFSGKTGNAIVDTSNTMKSEISTYISEINDTIDYINSVISKYQMIDSQIKDSINGSL